MTVHDTTITGDSVKFEDVVCPAIKVDFVGTNAAPLAQVEALTDPIVQEESSNAHIHPEQEVDGLNSEHIGAIEDPVLTATVKCHSQDENEAGHPMIKHPHPEQETVTEHKPLTEEPLQTTTNRDQLGNDQAATQPPALSICPNGLPSVEEQESMQEPEIVEDQVASPLEQPQIIDLEPDASDSAANNQDDKDISIDIYDVSLWSGWAEIENDPDIFTTLPQQWHVPNLQVCEIFDIAELLTADPAQIAGLVFLSRYRPSEQAATSSSISIPHQDHPWFANQISKFSCGTVALVNVIMNAGIPLGDTLTELASASDGKTAKERGILLDDHATLRTAHNSFSTLLDRQIVDVVLKEEVQKHKAQQAADNRKQKAGKKRKRSVLTRKKKPKAHQDEYEDGNHFVAYIPAHGRVWKVDGLLSKPVCCGDIPAGEGETWLHVASADLFPQMEQALSLNDHCSLMRVTKLADTDSLAFADVRKQEDWAPFIAHMLRLHAERGDLQQMLSR